MLENVIQRPSAEMSGCSLVPFPSTPEELTETRVVVPALDIDLPVIRQPGSVNSFPPCNVAMYITQLRQPGEKGPTYIYAHARTGMFLPLLTASKVNNGAAMIGKSVRVYTSDSEVYVYRVRKVIRHTLSMAPAFAVASQQVWLQTSEGPYRTSKKLFVVAKLTGVYATTYAASHPRVRPYSCS